VTDRLRMAVSAGRRGSRATRDEFRTLIREWRRSRVAKRRTRSKKTYALTFVFVALVGTFGACMAYLAPQAHGVRLSFDQFTSLASTHRLSSLTFRDEESRIAGAFLCEAPGKVVTADSPPACQSPSARTEPFWVSYPKSDSATALLLQVANDSGAQVFIDPQTRKAETRLVTTLLLPLMLLATIFVLLFTANKGGSSGIGEVETFGSIGKGRFSRRKKTPITFDQIAGADEAVAELREVRDYLADPERYQRLGALPPRGVLLVGPPGCGKTLLAKAVAGEVGVPFFSVAGAEFVESLVGVGAARVRDLFARVRAVAPAVVFIDELDAAGRKRGGGGGGNEEREQTLNQLLVEMDGFDISAGIVVMGATNRPDILDPALLRPGRFDRQVTVDLPDVHGREKILELHARSKPFSADVDFLKAARRTPGFSGADLANVVNEAVLLAIRANKEEVEVEDLDEAVQRTLSGSVRRTLTLTPAERKQIAVHESGHVILAVATGRFADVHRVSILTRGRNLGGMSMGTDESAVITFTGMQSRLAIHMAGVAAEDVVFGESSTGAELDIASATLLARDMVGRYGMSDKIGRVRLLGAETDEFLEGEVVLNAVAGATHQDFDSEVRRLIGEATREAVRVLSAHRATLDRLAHRLEVEETLEGADLEDLLVEVQPEMDLFGSLVGNRNGQVNRVSAMSAMEE
jgi:cell division protease FtsH